MRSVLPRIYVTDKNFVDIDDDVDCVFFCLPSSSSVFFSGWSRLSLSFLFLSCSPSHFGPVSLLLGGDVVVRETSGLHPRVSYVDVDLVAGI